MLALTAISAFSTFISHLDFSAIGSALLGGMRTMWGSPMLV